MTHPKHLHHRGAGVKAEILGLSRDQGGEFCIAKFPGIAARITDQQLTGLMHSRVMTRHIGIQGMHFVKEALRL
jgi:hypothetical protein